jgi:magnesium chelatase family protein
MTVTRYQKRISGPLLDRVDIHVDVPRVAYQKLTDQRLGESSETVRRRVEAARQKQRSRFAGTDLACNPDMRPADVRKYCKLDDAGTSLLKAALNQLQLSGRAFHRVLKLTRTIADLAGSESIQPAQLAEAIQYRPRRQG